ncbi:hypothetical protein [Rhodococcoides fascians]|uniref:hypothetical protein n=1 Tax=Rhodococcoides fascians TaxID=1828 RepID=UPI001E35BC67|nr:hypothetical protein [Rhodococcus fascians]
MSTRVKTLCAAAAIAMSVTACASAVSPSPVAEPTQSAESQSSGFVTIVPEPSEQEPAEATSEPNLVDPSPFAVYAGGAAGYYFTTPSGLWRCAILGDSAQRGPDERMTGCQPKTSTDMAVAGAPQVQQFGSSKMGAPNAILVNAVEPARFASLSQALFWRMDGLTPVLPYGETLAVDGFTCNVQESGVSCRSDNTGHGFQFSTNGYVFEYAEASGVAHASPQRAAEPVLGRVWGPHQTGYGEVRPPQVFNGGSPSGMIDAIVWNEWGGPVASGIGKAPNVAVADSVATAPIEPSTVVGYDLGDCDGVWMYKSVVWFFPQNGETFESVRGSRGLDSCEEIPYVG